MNTDVDTGSPRGTGESFAIPMYTGEEAAQHGIACGGQKGETQGPTTSCLDEPNLTRLVQIYLYHCRAAFVFRNAYMTKTAIDVAFI